MREGQQKILLVEDDRTFAEIVRDYLLATGYRVELHFNGVGVVDRVRHYQPDLLLIDLMLPGIHGDDICKRVRQFSDLPIIMLTAKISEDDRLSGYEIGADDYICKPVKPREILARVKAVLRRISTNPPPAAPSPLQLNSEQVTASLYGTFLDLTRMEFRILELLASHQGRVYSRQQILDALYPNDDRGSLRAADTHVKNLRRKLAAAAPEQELIHSVYGLGYKLQWHPEH